VDRLGKNGWLFHPTVRRALRSWAMRRTQERDDNYEGRGSEGVGGRVLEDVGVPGTRRGIMGLTGDGRIRKRIGKWLVTHVRLGDGRHLEGVLSLRRHCELKVKWRGGGRETVISEGWDAETEGYGVKKGTQAESLCP